MVDFYYRKRDSVIGPMTGIDLREAAFIGAVLPATLISNNLAGPWFTASCAVGFFDKEGNPLPHPIETQQEIEAIRESEQTVADSQHAQEDQTAQPNYMNFISPCCSFSMQVPVALEGKQGKCPRCEGVVLITATQAPTPTQPAATSPTQPAATQPAATQPAATQPAAAFPAPTQPAAAFPAPTQSAAAFPAPSQSAAAFPAPSQSAAAFPAPLSPSQPAAAFPAPLSPSQPAAAFPAPLSPSQPAAAFPAPLSPTQGTVAPPNPSGFTIDPALLTGANSGSAVEEQFRNESYLTQAQDRIQKNQEKHAAQVENKGVVGAKIVAKCVIGLVITVGLVVFGTILVTGFNDMKDWRGEFVEKNMQRKADEWNMRNNLNR